MKKFLAILLISLLLASGLSFALSNKPIEGRAKNVIVLIGDGMGISQVYITKLCYGHLAMEDFPYSGYEMTDSLSGEVTDSAAAGTAIATGFKTYNKIISQVKNNGKYYNVTTLLELAKKLDKATGLVTTTRITHATPAVFGAHVENRDMEKEIAKQYLEKKINVLLGGGKEEFSNELLEKYKEEGYEIVYNKDQLEKANSKYLLGLFSDSHIPYVLDRNEDVPSLLDMTKKAIEILEKNPNGFFLMVEGGRIDHACHGNDIASVVAETKEFDDVVRYCLNYAKKRGDTLVIVLADHETGGLGLGLNYGDSIDEDKILNIKASAYRMAKLIKEGADPKTVLKTYANIELSKDELQKIDEALKSTNKYALSNTIAEIIDERVGVKFISHKHTAVPVPLLAYGPGAEDFMGFHHHVDTSKLVAKDMLFRGDYAVSIKGITHVKGDANGDFKVDKEDAYITLLYYVGNFANTDQEKLLDMDNNGVIDYNDVYLILEQS
ncbi:alkaline phosphatase [Methanocaldococcus infernus]